MVAEAGDRKRADAQPQGNRRISRSGRSQPLEPLGDLRPDERRPDELVPGGYRDPEQCVAVDDEPGHAAGDLSASSFS